MCFWLVEMLKKIGAQFGYLTPPNLHVYYPFVDFSKVHGYPDKINIGYAMKPRGLQPHGNLYKHPHMKCKGVYGFQGYLNPVGPESSSYKVIYSQSNCFSPLQHKLRSISLLSNGYSSNSQ